MTVRVLIHHEGLPPGKRLRVSGSVRFDRDRTQKEISEESVTLLTDENFKDQLTAGTLKEKPTRTEQVEGKMTEIFLRSGEEMPVYVDEDKGSVEFALVDEEPVTRDEEERRQAQVVQEQNEAKAKGTKPAITKTTDLAGGRPPPTEVVVKVKPGQSATASVAPPSGMKSSKDVK
jgi:hypothetical protein